MEELQILKTLLYIKYRGKKNKDFGAIMSTLKMARSIDNLLIIISKKYKDTQANRIKAIIEDEIRDNPRFVR